MANEEHFILIIMKLMSLNVYSLHIFNREVFFLQVAFGKYWGQV